MSIFSDWITNTRVVIFGRNAAVINTAEESIAPQSALVAHLSAATLLEIASASASDAAAGTGARTIRIHGLTSAAVYQTEDITLDGQTAVTSVATFLHVFGAEVLTVGSGGKNAGIVYVADDSVTWTAGVPSVLTATFAQIPVGANVSQNGWFMVPAGRVYRLRKMWIANTTQIVTVRLYVREGSAGLTYLYGEWAAAAGGTSQAFHFDDNEIVLPAQSLLEFRGQAATTGAVTSVTALLDRRD